MSIRFGKPLPTAPPPVSTGGLIKIESSTSPLQSGPSLTTFSHGSLISILPFNPSPDYDLVLKTSDGGAFLAHEAVLRLASTSPDRILNRRGVSPGELAAAQSRSPSSALPCLGNADVDDANYDLVEESAVIDQISFRVYDVDASSSTLDALLRLLYPGARSPAFASPEVPVAGGLIDPSVTIKSIGPVVNLAQRLKMPNVVADLCMKLLSVVNSPYCNPDNPVAFRVFITACRFQLADVAQAAAYACLRGRGFESYTSELESIRADSYFKLIDYRRKVTRALLDALEKSDFARVLTSPESAAAASTMLCDVCSQAINGGHSTHAGLEWWRVFHSFAIEILQTAPRSDKIFSIAFLSQVLDSMKSCDSCSKKFLLLYREAQHSLKINLSNAIDSVKLDLSCLNK